MNSVLKKSPEESFVVMNELVLPNDTNTFHNLMGGRLLHWMDIASTIVAQRHSENVVMTLSVDNVSFKETIPLGAVVTMKAKVTRAFNTSMEIFISVTAEEVAKGRKISSNSAFYTFVALDELGRPTPVPAVEPKTDNEKKMYHEALLRRELRLVMAGRMKPNKAVELKSFFRDE